MNDLKDRETIKATLYFVNYSPDDSHLYDYCVFDRLKDARAFCSSLPDTPLGYPRPYKITRGVYKKSGVYFETVEFSDIETRKINR